MEKGQRLAVSRAGVHSLGVLCGGTAAGLLLGAGATDIYNDPADLLARLGDTGLLD